MSKKILHGISQHGRRLFERVAQLGKEVAKVNKDPLVRVPKSQPCLVQRLTQKQDGIISKYVANNFTPFWAKQLQNAARYRTHFGYFPLSGNYRAMGHRLSMFAFVAMGMASNSSALHSEIEEGEEDVFSEIKERAFEVLLKKQASTESQLIPNIQSEEEQLNIDHFRFGSMIAKGCCGAVYEAKYCAPESDIDILSEIEEEPAVEIKEETTESEKLCDELYGFHLVEEDYYSDSDIEIISEQDVESFHLAEEFGVSVVMLPVENSKVEDENSHDLAIKMMFNFDTESVAHAIWSRMENELVPSRMLLSEELMDNWHNGIKAKMKALPPHPNVVNMCAAFVGDVPHLKDALDEYPDALPERLHPDGYGRNKTLFIVMERYPLTLREYLLCHSPSLKESVLLFTQLMEAVLHLQDNGVAHRDLKSDNLLITFDADDNPRLVLTDFGCCLQSGSFGLRVHYTSHDICKGGNASLMAPEVSTACPAWNSWLDYSKSDSWAAAAIAYEIFGAQNPFYRDADGRRLDGRFYSLTDLPSLPDHVPEKISSLVFSLLARNPAQRPEVRDVLRSLHMWLWAPEEWTSQPPSPVAFRRWLLSTAASVMLRVSSGGVESTLQALYLQRSDFRYH